MQTYDLVMIAVLAAAVLFGAWKGLAWQVASLAALFASYLAALRFRGLITPLISADPPWNTFIAMFAIYIAVSLVIWIAFGFVRKFIVRFHLKDFDRQAGALLGALKGALLCMIITLFAVTLLGKTYKESICRSRSGNFIARAINELHVAVPPELHEVLDPLLEKFNTEMQSHQTYLQGQGGQPGEGGLAESALPANGISGTTVMPAPSADYDGWSAGTASSGRSNQASSRGTVFEGQVQRLPAGPVPNQWLYDPRTGQWVQATTQPPATASAPATPVR
jgi:membrane protein required for colicin V production